jgi:hypothetical protein
MTEEMKHRLNFSMIEFVNRYSDHKGRFSTKDVGNAYRNANPDLIRASGVTPDQLSRMVEYVLVIGYPEDPFLCSEFPFNIEPTNAPSDLTQADLRRIDAAFELRIKEIGRSGETIRRLRDLLQPHDAKHDKPARELIKLLEADYHRAKSSGERQSWIDEIDSLIGPVRRMRPGLRIGDALFATMPKRLAVPPQPMKKGNAHA